MPPRWMVRSAHDDISNEPVSMAIRPRPLTFVVRLTNQDFFAVAVLMRPPLSFSVGIANMGRLLDTEGGQCRAC